MIADAERPVAVAGIMGGEETEVSAETTTVLLEAANFEQLGVLRSEASGCTCARRARARWEKGVAPCSPSRRPFSRRSCSSSSRAHAGRSRRRAAPSCPRGRSIRLRPERADEVLGHATPPGTEQHERLDAARVRVGDDWVVRTLPAVARARRHGARSTSSRRWRGSGSSDVPGDPAPSGGVFGRLTPEQRLRRLVGDVLVGARLLRGVHLARCSRPTRIRTRFVLPEPLSALQRVLRTTLAAERLIDPARRNADLGRDAVALFEIAHVYLPTSEALPDERWHVAGIAAGGYARAKGAVEAALRGAPPSSRRSRGRAASVLADAGVGERAVGVGRRRATTRGCSTASGASFELDLDELLSLVPERVLLPGRRHVPADSRRIWRSTVAEGRRRQATSSPLRARRPARSCASCACSTSTAAPQVGEGQQVGRVLRSRTSRPSGRFRTRTRRGCGSGSSRRSAAASAPSCARSVLDGRVPVSETRTCPVASRARSVDMATSQRRGHVPPGRSGRLQSGSSARVRRSRRVPADVSPSQRNGHVRTGRCRTERRPR